VIIKTKVLLPQAYVTLAGLSSVNPLCFLLSTRPKGLYIRKLYVLQYGYTWCRKLAAEQLDELVGAMSQPVADPGSKPTSRMVNNTTFKN
jgi:hypothetical protein